MGRSIETITAHDISHHKNLCPVSKYHSHFLVFEKWKVSFLEGSSGKLNALVTLECEQSTPNFFFDNSIMIIFWWGQVGEPVS